MTPGRALSLALLLAPLIALTALVWAEGRRLQQGARPMADRIPLDHLTSDQLDQLYDERDQHAATINRVRQVATQWAVLRTYGGAAYELRAALDQPQHTT